MAAFFQRLWRSKILLILELILIAALGVSVGKQVFKKEAIGGEIGALEADIGKLETQKNDLLTLLDYVKTDGFVETEARNKLNLAKAGESVVLIPRADTDPGATAENPPTGNAVLALADPAPPPSASNLVKWWQYFFEQQRFWEN